MKLKYLTIHKIYIFLILFSSPFYNGETSMYKGQVYIYIQILLFMIVAILLKMKNGIKIPKKAIGIFYFTLFIYLYYTFTTLLFTENIINRDIIDFFRPFIYLFIILFPLIFKINTNDFIRLIKFSAKLFIIQILINFFVFIEPLQSFIDIYKVQHSGINYYKFSGTFGFSYTYSHFMLLGLLFAIFLYDKTYKMFIFISFIFLTIMFSGSRAGMVATLLILCLIFIIERKRNINYLLIKLFLFFTLVIVGILLSGIEISYITTIFDYVMRLVERGTNDPSAGHRMGELTLAFEILQNNFLFGSGSNKYYINEILGLHLESLYSYYLAKWGFVGFSLYILHLFILSITSYNLGKLYKDNIYIYIYSRVFIYWVIAIGLFGLSISVTDSYRGPFIFYTVVGYIFMLYFQKKKELQNAKR